MPCIIALVVIGLLLCIGKLLETARGGGATTARPAGGRGPSAGSSGPPSWSMSAAEYRIQDSRLGDKGDGPRMQSIQLRGLFPILRPVRLGAVTHVYDAETKLPLISALDQFQETDSVVFQFETEIGLIRPNQGFTDWVRVGAAFPEIMNGPVGGNRRLHAIVRFIDLDNPPPIRYGSHPPGHPGLLWTSDVLSFVFEFEGKGFQELGQEQEDALAAAIRVAVYMAMTDGSMHEAEGKAIKEWVRKTLSGFSETKQKSLKDRLNMTLREAFDEARRNELDLEDALLDLEDVEDSAIKYQVLQLAFDVLAADGRVEPSEMRVIEQIADVLDLDVKEVERIRDQKLLGLGTSTIATASIDDVLGIKSEWDRDTIQRHLRTEFQKWNGRLNSLQDGPERQSAQRMIDMIAEARKKHA